MLVFQLNVSVQFEFVLSSVVEKKRSLIGLYIIYKRSDYAV